MARHPAFKARHAVLGVAESPTLGFVRDRAGDVFLGKRGQPIVPFQIEVPDCLQQSHVAGRDKVLMLDMILITAGYLFRELDPARRDVRLRTLEDQAVEAIEQLGFGPLVAGLRAADQVPFLFLGQNPAAVSVV
jgi:hypothetical protein